MSVSKGSACMCHVAEGSLCSLRGCFIHREHSFLDASHAAFVESSTMWPYACLSDCKVMVKCVESDGKVIATHVSVQSHHQPVRPDRERVATHHVSHACDSAKLTIGSIRCQRCWVGGLGCFIRCHLTPPAATHAIRLSLFICVA